MSDIMQDVFTDVKAFMLSCSQTVEGNNPQQTELYLKLIQEEYGEFVQAIKEKNDVETIDACFDTIWVIIGYMISRGWNCHDIWEEGAESNFGKIDDVSGMVLKRADGKILKPEGWTPPDFSKFV